jgi:DUF4097 and DUF4098 domain-containing protein YvlB
MKRRFAWEPLLAAAVIAIGIHIPLEAALTEELHKTFPIDADGRVSLNNVNGAVHIAAWDRNEVQVDAVKSAKTKEALSEAQIVIDSATGSISIRTRYPEHHDRHDSASVEYTLKVPRRARLHAIEAVNGAVEVSGVSGDVKISSVNGPVIAKNLAGGEARLSTVNGRLEASFDKLSGASSIALDTVNGSISLAIPDQSSADFQAHTVHGSISSDFRAQPPVHGHHIGGSLSGQIGGGGAHIKLSTVNGGIRILSTIGGHRVLHT